MSDTTVTTPETENLETPTAPTPESSGETSPNQGEHPQGDRDRGARKPRRGNDRRGGIREEAKEFQEEILSIARVTRVTAGGRQLRFRVAIIIGDGKGRVGLGMGKSGEVQGAIEKAIRDAKKNLITFPIVDGTIAHDVTVNFKSSAIYLHPAHPGTGIIAGGAARKVFAVSGVKDVIAKQHGAPNTVTNARVTLKALQSLKPTAQIKSFAAKTASSEKKVASEKETTDEKPAPKKAPAKKETTASKTPAKKAAPKKAPAKKEETK